MSEQKEQNQVLSRKERYEIRKKRIDARNRRMEARRESQELARKEMLELKNQIPIVEEYYKTSSDNISIEICIHCYNYA